MDGLEIAEVLYKEKPANYTMEGHAHDGAEICYVDRGAVNVVSGVAGFALTQGELCIFAPHEPHRVSADVDRHPGPNIVTILLEGSPLDLRRLHGRRLSLTPQERTTLHALLVERERDEPYRADMERALLITLLVSLLRRDVAASSATTPATERSRHLGRHVVDEATAYIKSHLDEALSIDTIARAVNISPSHLSHSFSSVAGTGPMKYVRAMRIQHAKELVRTSPLSMTEIAHATGFRTVQHFSRTFKLVTGFTPSGYARSVR